MRYLVLPAFLALAACQSPPAAGPTPLDFTPRCGADRLQGGLIGQDAGIIPEIEIDAPPLRVIHPGMEVTADYNPARLNIAVDENGIITRVWCV